jgi:hypothetical protein
MEDRDERKKTKTKTKTKKTKTTKTKTETKTTTETRGRRAATRAMEAAEYLDAVLVPCGLLLLLLYCAQLAYRVHTCPSTTVIGINQMNRQAWVRTMMQVRRDRNLCPSIALPENLSPGPVRFAC